MQKLAGRLLKDYDARVPGYGANRSDIAVGFRVNEQIFDLDAKTGAFKVFVWLRMFFRDERLLYNGKDAFGPGWRSKVDFLALPSENIWVPDLKVLNSFLPLQTTERTRAYVYDDSHQLNVFWSTPMDVGVHCPSDLQAFPFDNQTCLIKFSSWSGYSAWMSLVPLSEVASFDAEVVVSPTRFPSAWRMTNISSRSVEHVYTATDDAQWPEIWFEVKLERHPHWYVANVILPLVVLLCTSQALLWTPRGHDRVALASTNLLTTFAAMLFTASVRPMTEQITWLDEFLIGAVCMNGLLMIGCVLTSIEPGSFELHLCCRVYVMDMAKWSVPLDNLLTALFPVLVIVFFGFMLGRLNPHFTGDYGASMSLLVTSFAFTGLVFLAASVMTIAIATRFMRQTLERSRSLSMTDGTSSEASSGGSLLWRRIEASTSSVAQALGRSIAPQDRAVLGEAPTPAPAVDAEAEAAAQEEACSIQPDEFGGRARCGGKPGPSGEAVCVNLPASSSAPSEFFESTQHPGPSVGSRGVPASPCGSGAASLTATGGNAQVHDVEYR